MLQLSVLGSSTQLPRNEKNVVTAEKYRDGHYGSILSTVFVMNKTDMTNTEQAKRNEKVGRRLK